MTSLWQSLESIPGLKAVPATWRRWWGNEYETLRAAWLQATPKRAKSVPCQRHCGCAHEVVEHADDSCVGVCQCEWGSCDDFPVTDGDRTILELNRAKLGRSIARAFECDVRVSEVLLWETWQIGAYSADAVPMILTLQGDRTEFRRIAAELVTRVRGRLILFAPTSQCFDARCKEILENVGAAMFDLESNLVVTGQGNLQARKRPGELFARFAPEAKDLDEDVARQTFALIQRLESGNAVKPPAVLTVFRLYCVEEMTAEQVARKCRCSKGTVINRLQEIRRVTGTEPEKLRVYSPHFEKIEEELGDADVYRKGLVE